MNSNWNWHIVVPKSVQKHIKRFPASDAERIRLILREMSTDLFIGDSEKLSGYENTWRRRVGSYRIIYEILSEKRVVLVNEVKRRTSSTY